MTERIELWLIRPPAPDGLVKVTRQPSGGGSVESWLVLPKDAEETVLDRWREEHRRVREWEPAW